MELEDNYIDNKLTPDILTPEETAQYLRKSLSWVYKNWKILGGRKLGGSLVFPRKEELYERVFRQRQRVEVRLHPGGDQAHGGLVQNKNKSKTGRSKKKGGIKKLEAATTRDKEDPNRYGLLDIG
jgi:hypothetical protein